MFWLIVPLGLQALVMAIDEFYFHHKRGLPLWEQLGHPLDTFFVGLCFLFICLAPPNEMNLKIYVGLCALSCLIITKDEFIHTEKCEAMENWLHSLLFILHPITFFAAGIIWKNNLSPEFLKIQMSILFLFMFYQFFYWRLHGKSKQHLL